MLLVFTNSQCSMCHMINEELKFSDVSVLPVSLENSVPFSNQSNRWKRVYQCHEFHRSPWNRNTVFQIPHKEIEEIETYSMGTFETHHPMEFTLS